MAAPADVINFYRTADPYGEFSNFSAHPFAYKGQWWRTSEHAFQALKFKDSPTDREAIRNLVSPMDAASAGRERSRPLRSDWEEVKDEVMFEAVLAKFSQNKDIREVLLGTGNKTLVEHTKNDSYWGDGGDGSGKNMLGITLMKVRDTLRETQARREAESDKLKFFGDDEEFGAFANFYPAEFNFKDVTYPTVEHAFQALKFEPSEKDVKEVAAMLTPKDAAKAGRDRSRPLRSDWEEVKIPLMENLLLAKFSQNPHLKELLLSTGDKEIIENSPKDNYWGCGADGTGKNMLGQCLMKVRAQLRE